MAVLNRVLIGVLGAMAVVGVPGLAAAEPPPDPPPPPPAPPNVNALAPVKLSEYAVMDGNWYAFTTPGRPDVRAAAGQRLRLQRSRSPARPTARTLVSGRHGGAPALRQQSAATFSAPQVRPSRCPPVRGSASRPSAAATTARRRHASTTASQSGFRAQPGGQFHHSTRNPLLDRPEGTNPFIN